MLGLVEYAPVIARLEMVTGLVNNPNPPRTTVLPWKTSGVHAKPARGLNRCEVLWYTALSLGLANVRPPRTSKSPTGISEIGFLAYAAWAAACSGLAAVPSKPSTVLPYFSW